MPQQADPQLSDIQAWLHTFVVEPGTQDDALAAAEKKAGFEAGSAEDLILPSPTLQPRERIQIYRRMYLLRMYDALEIDFPTLLERLGRKKFRQIVAEYVETHPSSSYTLDHLGRSFAKYLRTRKDIDSPAFVGELADLEWSICEVAIAPDTPVIVMTDLGEIDPERFVEIVLKPVDAFQHWTFSHNVNAYYKAWSKDEELPEIAEETVRLVVWRQQLTVWRQELSEPAHEFLKLLISGHCLGEALDQIIEKYEQSEEKLFEWFQNWVAEGFFASYSLPEN